MGIADRAKRFIDQHEGKIDSAAAKAGEIADRRTRGKYSDKISKAVDTVQRKTGSDEPGATGAPGSGPGGGPAAGPATDGDNSDGGAPGAR
jgi:hypothetical protein